MPVRDHQGITLATFNGYWNRGDVDTTPIDHFSDCNNIRFTGNSFKTRDGIGISQNVAVPLYNIKRIYNYPTQTANTLLVLTWDGTTGIIYHVVSSILTYSILTITGMEDFAFVPYAGRAFISPFSSITVGTNVIEVGLSGQFLYVYAGDGTAARKAAGSGMTGTMTVAFGAAGHTDPGLHIFGFVSQTISGYNAPPSVLTPFTTVAASSVSFGSIPTSGDPTVVKRLLVSSKAIDPTIFAASPDLTGYELFFVPNGVINDNTSTFLNNISFYDADLLADASNLLSNYTAIPAGASLSLYHERLCLAATATDISLMLVSQPGEPEAINQITGLIVVPLDGNPITNAQEMRDVLYVFKRARTIAYADNGGDPVSWPSTIIDNALGTCVHGIATVLDSGSSSIDYLIICTYQGISQFNGKYVVPELSWKIEGFWKILDRTKFNIIQIINAPIQKEIYVILPTRNMLVGNYANGMDWKNIRWSPWSFTMPVNSVAVQNISDIILGMNLT
jgi:hypothetical protein